MHHVHFCGGEVGPPTQNGWAVPTPKDRQTLLPKLKGRREGVENTIKEGTSEGIPKGEVTLTNRLGGSVGIENPSRIG